MLKELKTILEIQELDMKMLRLARLKKERQKELDHIASLRQEFRSQLAAKEEEIQELNRNIIAQENKIAEAKDRLKKLEAKQNSLKKVEEYKALTQEMSSAEKERSASEQLASDFIDKRNAEEEILTKIKESFSSSETSSLALEKEIHASIKMINEEGRALKKERDLLAGKANKDFLHIYERLLTNKKDRVVVPMENRTCSGCHITLTAQHENLVRKGERLVFCEHCSRILYWQEMETLQESAEKPSGKKRRRRATI